jgi:hypothetical protein
MMLMLLSDEQLDGQIDLGRACAEAATTVLQRQRAMMLATLALPRICIDGVSRISTSMISTSMWYGQNAATAMFESFGQAYGSDVTTMAPSAPALTRKGAPRRPKDVAAA